MQQYFGSTHAPYDSDILMFFLQKGFDMKKLKGNDLKKLTEAMFVTSKVVLLKLYLSRDLIEGSAIRDIPWYTIREIMKY